MKLRVTNHDRDVTGMTYVYAVVSRRAGGVSMGINLNPNNACNYRCIYCQVPDLVLGKAPPTDLAQLETELRTMLQAVVHGDFMQQRVEPEHRRLVDVAISGNGEPTSSPQFLESVGIVERALDEFAQRGAVKVVLITNGTLTDRPGVLEGIEKLATLGGEVWFKLDSGTEAGTRRINNHEGSLAARLARVETVARACPTWLQTCVFALDGNPPSDDEQRAYLEVVSELRARRVPLQGILLYGLARPSLQPEAPRLSRVSESFMNAFAERLRATGVAVRVSL